MTVGVGKTTGIEPGKEAPAMARGAGAPPADGDWERFGTPRPYERLAAGYFALTGLLAVGLGSPRSAWWPIVLLHASLVVTLLVVLPRARGRWLRALRDWVLILALPLIYKEIGLLNDLVTNGYHDQFLLRLEETLFGSQPSVILRELLPWHALSEYLHFGYFGYYILLPGLTGSLYVRHRYPEFSYALTVILGVFFFCYLWFIVFPVAGPWYVLDRPDPMALGRLFPPLVHIVLLAGSAKGAAFPSSHVAVAVVIWLLAWQLSRGVFWAFAPVVPALIIGTVYGGFHYAVDALAGVATGAAGYLAGPWLWRVLGGREEGSGVANKR